MKLPGKATVATNVLALLFLAYLYVGDVLDYGRALTAEASALHKLPNVIFASLVLATTGAVVVMLAVKLTRGADAADRVFRLLPIVAVVALFVDLFVLSADDAVINPPDQAAVALQMFTEAASARSTANQVPTSERDLTDLLKDLGAPPYLLKGKPATAYSLSRRDNCTGPVEEAPGVQVGTFIYCVAPDRKSAWVTVMALPYEERFGVPRVLSRQGVSLVTLVRPPTPGQPELPADSLSFDQLPNPIDGGVSE